MQIGSSGHTSRVIYIIGEGRSGSTLLDVALGSGINTCACGELWSFFDENVEATGPCSCGKAVSDCEFWQSVTEIYLATTGHTNLAHIDALRRREDRAVWLPVKLIGYRSRYFKEYCQYMSTLYGTIAIVSGATTIVDSTKAVGRGFNLTKCDGLDTYVIHLVRDGRGVCWSRIRDFQRNPNIDRSRWRRNVIVNAVLWSVKNIWALVIGKTLGSRYLVVRYEDLVSDPHREIDRIQNAVGLNFAAASDTPSEWKPAHQIGGNIRTRSVKQIELKPDIEWRQNLSLVQQITFWIIAWPLCLFFGYRFDGQIGPSNL